MSSEVGTEVLEGDIVSSGREHAEAVGEQSRRSQRAGDETIRLEQRKKANRATINGVSLLPIEKTLEMGKKIVELRTKLTVDAIAKAMASSK